MVDLPGRRRTRAEQVQQTRERFLQAGGEVFARRGFDAASLEEISALAGYTRAAIYRYFPSKAALLVACVEAEVDTLLQRRDEVLRHVSGEATLLSEFGATVIAETLVGTERWRTAMTEFERHAEDEPELHARIATFIKDSERRNRDILRRLCRALGVEPPMPLDDLNHVMEALAYGLYLQGGPGSEQRATKLFSDVLNLLLANGEASSRPRSAERAGKAKVTP
jgi:AcrR family transcriptional regulator